MTGKKEVYVDNTVVLGHKLCKIYDITRLQLIIQFQLLIEERIFNGTIY